MEIKNLREDKTGAGICQTIQQNWSCYNEKAAKKPSLLFH